MWYFLHTLQISAGKRKFLFNSDFKVKQKITDKTYEKKRKTVTRQVDCDRTSSFVVEKKLDCFFVLSYLFRLYSAIF